MLRSTTTDLGGNEVYEYVGAMERLIKLNCYSTPRHHVCSQQTHMLILNSCVCLEADNNVFELKGGLRSLIVKV